MRLPKIFLIKELKRHLRAGHPWVFSDALRVPASTPAGVVTLCEPGPKARFVAYGLYQPQSPLAFRVLSLDESMLPNETLVNNRISSAFSLRKKFVDQQTNAYRLLHGEGDFTPGILCDIYHDTAVIKYDSDAAKTFYDSTVIEFLPRLGIRNIYERFYEKESTQRGMTRFGAVTEGDIEIKEHGLLFGVDIVQGQKTGFFLDQRENRGLVRALSQNKSVLNCFSYTGGFSVAAAAGGASCVTSVDIAAPVITAAKKNFSRNGFDLAEHRFFSEDAFAFLQQEMQRHTLYDLVILDPPSFAPNEKAKEKALSAYRELNLAGLRVLSLGGVLCTASCSSHVTEEEFISSLRDAARELRRPLRIVAKRGAGFDHPVPPAFTEGNYLKFIVAV